MCWSEEAMTVRPANADHPIMPKPGTVIRESDGEPGNMFAPLDFPLLARCITCNGLVREERWFASKGWVHIQIPQPRHT